MNQHISRACYIRQKGIDMKRFYKDFYGCSASISETNGKFRLKVRLPNGTLDTNKVYNTERGAKSAMSRSSDGWNEVQQKSKARVTLARG